jgi:hypothetical protein
MLGIAGLRFGTSAPSDLRFYLDVWQIVGLICFQIFGVFKRHWFEIVTPWIWGYKFFFLNIYQIQVLLLSLTSLSLSLLVRVRLIRRRVNYLFCQNNVSHELMHHAESKILFELMHMFDLVWIWNLVWIWIENPGENKIEK